MTLPRTAASTALTFYYHFKDIYDLVEWSCLEDARKLWRKRRPTTPGSRAFCRYSRPFGTISPYNECLPLASIGSRWKNIWSLWWTACSWASSRRNPGTSPCAGGQGVYCPGLRLYFHRSDAGLDQGRHAGGSRGNRLPLARLIKGSVAAAWPDSRSEDVFIIFPVLIKIFTLSRPVIRILSRGFFCLW